MKIGMILDAIYPSDARVTNECEELIKNGHEIYLFCLSYKKNYIKSEIINDIKVRRYYCSSLIYKLSALANDFPFYSISMKSKIKDLFSKTVLIRCIFMIYKLLKLLLLCVENIILNMFLTFMKTGMR